MKTLTQKAAEQAHKEILAAFEGLIDSWQEARNEASEQPLFEFSEKAESRHSCYVHDPRRGLEWLAFIIGVHGNRYEVIAKHMAMLESRSDLCDEVKKELRGKDLVCCCKPLKCHGDTLLEIANECT